MMQSAARSTVATLAAFWSARRSTFAGVITPMSSRSPYSRVSALKPKLGSLSTLGDLGDDDGALDARVVRDGRRGTARAW
jgi:hypothetical protein